LLSITPARYLDLFRDDAELLGRVAGRDLDRPIPTCPGWDVREVVRHSGSVYLHKVEWLRRGRRPQDGEWESHPSEGEDLVGWFLEAQRRLARDLVRLGRDQPADTWSPNHRTVGFWYRRMALETVVHRVDVEVAFGELSAIDLALASDGVAEVLEVFLAARDYEIEDGVASGAVEVQLDDARWRVELNATETLVAGAVRADDGPAASATVSGNAPDLFLYLWGRKPPEAVRREGDIELVNALRHQLVAATQ
jgi:uncharacterized protein (TIGR03083 family)